MTTATYTPHRVRLVGHRDLGTVRARWVGCILELEDGTRYGPCALFEVQPVAEPVVVKPEPVGTWGGHEDWIAWGGGACPVSGDAEVSVWLRTNCNTVNVQPHQLISKRASEWEWEHNEWCDAYDIIAYRLVTPAEPVVQEPAPEPKPAAVLLLKLLKEWRQVTGHEPVWRLYSTGGVVLAGLTGDGWWTYAHRGPETGLRGKEKAVERLLANGAKWENPANVAAFLDHDTRAIRRFRPGDVAVMVDGTRRPVEAATYGHLLFTGGAWLTDAAAETAIAARVPADDGHPLSRDPSQPESQPTPDRRPSRRTGSPAGGAPFPPDTDRKPGTEDETP